ncbi:MAG: hypothetical protein KDD43_05865 [Bdellovibrionales bacterium]|nr:hypothetical protein [Bdellovibrionales bacterium]
MLGRRSHSVVVAIAVLLGLVFVSSSSYATMSYEREDKEISLHVRDGVNRLWFEIEIPFHEMGDSSKRLAAARAIHFLKEDLAQMWKEGKLPDTLYDLMDSSITLGELQYEQIYKRIQEASGAKVRKAIEEAVPGLADSQASKLSGVDWWRPAGIVVEAGIKGKFKLSFLKGMSGNFTEVVVPQCAHRIRKIPMQDVEKDKGLLEMLQDRKPGIVDRAYGVILTSIYGKPCTENLEVLLSKIQAHEGNDEFYNNYYIVEEAHVKSVRRLMFWADTRVGLKAASDDKTPGVHGKFGVGLVYGKLRRPEEFAGGTMSYSKTFQLPMRVRERVKTWVRTHLPAKFSALTTLNWGWNGKAGALMWNDRFFPYFLTGPEIGTHINPKGEVNPGTVMDVIELLGSSVDALSSAYDGKVTSREDMFSLEEYAKLKSQTLQTQDIKPVGEPATE